MSITSRLRGVSTSWTTSRIIRKDAEQAVAAATGGAFFLAGVFFFDGILLLG
jgi:hypothetical protein